MTDWGNAAKHFHSETRQEFRQARTSWNESLDDFRNGGREEILGIKVKSVWCVQLVSLTTMLILSVVDPLFEATIEFAFSTPHQLVLHAGWPRAIVIVTTIVVALASLITLLTATLGRRPQSQNTRSVRSLLAITAMVALWCSLAIHYDVIAWQAKRIRFACRVDELESIVAPLRVDWPTTDGELPTIGPYMAYPFGRPTSLVLLHSPRLASETVYVSAVERGSDGSIKLQLAGVDGGDWAEWHPPQGRPQSFVGGLLDAHELQAVCSIGSGWYLVRYQLT